MSVLKYKDGEVWKEAPIAITAGMNGKDGKDGKSAYQIAVENGFEGSETEWLASLKGADGRNGIDGKDGTNGTNGKDGKDGTNGKDGKTPIKGVDYFTQAEIQQIENNAAAKVDLSEYAKTADLSTVATSGSYEDLTNKPTIPAAYELPTASATTLGGVKVGSGLSITNGVLSATGGGVADSVDWSKVQNKPNFANVATSGDYNDLINQPIIPSIEGLASKTYVDTKVAAIKVPTVPTKISAFENDAGYLTEHQSLENYITKRDFATGLDAQNTANLALIREVNERIDGITVPTKVSELENDSGYLTEHQSLADYSTTTEVQAMIDASAGEGGKDEVYVGTTAPTDTNIKLWVDTSASGSSTPSSVSWNDITDKPTIPSIEGLASTTYVDNKVAAIVIPTVPTNISAFTNDIGYLTSHQSLADYSTTTQVQAMISSAINAITNGNEVSY